ncbi:MAG: hypothetical protein JXP48_01085, partial [Acidobacteria bacterium]|nr:hypothetical protein [Acidobacteriota bacterium]
AAVLFPNDPEIPGELTNEIQRKAWLESRRVRLDGFHGSDYRILDASMTGEVSELEVPYTGDDFNRRNRESCRFVAERLRDHVPPGGTVHLVPAEPIRREGAAVSESPAGGGSILGREIVRLSRPGFDPDRIYAVVRVDLQAGGEMGVGYRVYLDKSKATGKWILTGAARTRIY